MELHKASEIRAIDDYFRVVCTTEKSQVAMMTLLPDQNSGEFGNEHPESDQVLVVLEGRGHARVGSESVELEEGDVLCISAGEPHQVTADGAVALRTINVYAPKHYPANMAEEQKEVATSESFPYAT
jgi:mannose-6-phosphate isomerase-like protein (cupin superfamily)